MNDDDEYVRYLASFLYDKLLEHVDYPYYFDPQLLEKWIKDFEQSLP